MAIKIITIQDEPPKPRYWITPPELYARLSGYKFDFDPCPFPRPDGYNSLIESWGRCNYVNPPFLKADGPHGGPSAFVRKAIAEQALGKTSVFVLPAPNSIGLLLQAGAILTYGGKVRWLDTVTGAPCPHARHQIIAVLEG